MTVQEIRTRINARLTDGTGQARQGNSCRYRTTDGMSCAVGCLIPDSAYNPGAEGASVGQLRWVDGFWDTPEGVWDPRVKALADMLNNAGILATEKIRNILALAQHRHDNLASWDGSEYIGELV